MQRCSSHMIIFLNTPSAHEWHSLSPFSLFAQLQFSLHHSSPPRGHAAAVRPNHRGRSGHGKDQRDQRPAWWAWRPPTSRVRHRCGDGQGQWQRQLQRRRLHPAKFFSASLGPGLEGFKVRAGPGSACGLKKCFQNLKRRSLGLSSFYLPSNKMFVDIAALT